CQTYIRSPLTF
nr:immunoglobulin light chain junction region [Macaca mulatta]MOW74245.1 immunoglobulin light chain junction region [Macaca mulatta]